MPEVSDDGEENEEDAFEFTITESTTPIPVSLDASEMLSATVKAATVDALDSMDPLMDAPEHRIMPLGENEEDPAFWILLEASAGIGIRSGLLLPGPGT